MDDNDFDEYVGYRDDEDEDDEDPEGYDNEEDDEDMKPVNPKPIDVPMSAACATAVQEYVAVASATWASKICAYVIFKKSDGSVASDYRAGNICHASLNYRGSDDRVVVLAQKPVAGTEDFVRWVCRASPFSHGVLNKDNDDELLNHAVVVDLGQVGMGGALWLAKALRYNSEDTWRPGVWNKLVEAGLDNLSSFVLCSMLANNGTVNAGGHNSLFYTMTKAEFRVALAEFNKPELKNITSKATYPYKYDYYNVAQVEEYWWSVKAGKPLKKPDGWGGYIEVPQPGSFADLVPVVNEILKGK